MHFCEAGGALRQAICTMSLTQAQVNYTTALQLYAAVSIQISANAIWQQVQRSLL
jgi:hypothetical protein